MDDEEECFQPDDIPDDLLADPASLPVVPPPFTAHRKWTRLFALDQGGPGHDYYVFVLPNGLCVIGLAPSHTWLRPPATAVQGSNGHQAPAAPEQAAQAVTPPQQQGAAAAQEPVQAPTADAPIAPAEQSVVCHDGSGQGQSQPSEGHTAQAPQPKAPDKAAAAETEPHSADPPDAQGRKRQRLENGAGVGTSGQETGGAPAVTAGARQSIKVSFDVGRRDANVKQSGKNRSKGTQLEPTAALCILTDAAGNRYASTLLNTHPRVTVLQVLSRSFSAVMRKACTALAGHCSIAMRTMLQLLTMIVCSSAFVCSMCTQSQGQGHSGWEASRGQPATRRTAITT